MAGKFTIDHVGHVGIYVSDLDRSIAWYTEALGLTFRGRWPYGEGEIVFLRFHENHHDIVLMPAPQGWDDKNSSRLQHTAMEIGSRDEWLKALAELKRAGVQITAGPLVHGFEGGTGLGMLPGGSGSRSILKIRMEIPWNSTRT